MKFKLYPQEALKKAVIGAMSPAHMDLTKLMGENQLEDGEEPPYRANRMTLVAALGMGVRAGGTWSREEVAAMQQHALKGNPWALRALMAMQAKRRIDRTKTLGVLLWRIKYGGEVGPDAFLTVAHLLVDEFRRVQKHPIGPAYAAVMQCALTEWLHDRCEPCHGTGQTGRTRKQTGRNHPTLYTCASCGGTGAYEPGDQQRAQALHMDIETFMKKWSRRYEGVLARLQRIDRRTGSTIDRQLRRG